MKVWAMRLGFLALIHTWQKPRLCQTVKPKLRVKCDRTDVEVGEKEKEKKDEGLGNEINFESQTFLAENKVSYI